MDTVVVDACLVITFGNADRLNLLASTPTRRTVIPPHSAREVSRPPASVALADAIARGLIASEAIDVDDAAEQDAFREANEAPAFRDRGDAEVLALARSRRWILGSDDTALRLTPSVPLASPLWQVRWTSWSGPSARDAWPSMRHRTCFRSWTSGRG